VHAGSIHKVGAALQGAPSCNGWTFWHVEQAGDLLLLDSLRQQHLASFDTPLSAATQVGG
jgi:modification methylase